MGLILSTPDFIYIKYADGYDSVEKLQYCRHYYPSLNLPNIFQMIDANRAQINLNSV